MNIDKRGKYILDICILARMIILNGRMFGDIFGKMTCYRPLGCSVVDYCIISEELYNDIILFKVLDSNGLISDHCALSTIIKCKVLYNVKCSNIKLSNHEHKYIWKNKESLSDFQLALNSNKITSMIDNFMSNINRDLETDVNNLVNNFNDTMYTAADASLKKVKVNLKSKSKKTQNKIKPWYDKSLKSLEMLLLDKNKKLQKYPFDAKIRADYYSLRKQYKHFRKKKIKEYN